MKKDFISNENDFISDENDFISPEDDTWSKNVNLIQDGNVSLRFVMFQT